jgi:hypothetical protein
MEFAGAEETSLRVVLREHIGRIGRILPDEMP